MPSIFLTNSSLAIDLHIFNFFQNYNNLKKKILTPNVNLPILYIATFSCSQRILKRQGEIFKVQFVNFYVTISRTNVSPIRVFCCEIILRLRWILVLVFCTKSHFLAIQKFVLKQMFSLGESMLRRQMSGQIFEMHSCRVVGNSMMLLMNWFVYMLGQLKRYIVDVETVDYSP